MFTGGFLWGFGGDQRVTWVVSAFWHLLANRMTDRRPSSLQMWSYLARVHFLIDLER